MLLVPDFIIAGSRGRLRTSNSGKACRLYDHSCRAAERRQVGRSPSCHWSCHQHTGGIKRRQAEQIQAWCKRRGLGEGRRKQGRENAGLALAYGVLTRWQRQAAASQAAPHGLLQARRTRQQEMAPAGTRTHRTGARRSRRQAVASRCGLRQARRTS